MNFDDFIRELNGFVAQYGSLGVFIISLVGNAIPYATVPYLAVIAAMATQMKLNLLDIIVWSVVGGLGAALGKIMVYLTGLATSEVLPDRIKENMQIFAKLAKRGIFIAIFLFAALPLPDDVLYIPLGMARYPLFKFFLAVWMGKMIITFLSILFGNAYGAMMSKYHVGYGESAIILIAVTKIISVVIAKIDWLRVGMAISERGIGYATYVFLDELLKVSGVKKIVSFIKKKG
jgi:membrane protein DedA with SNARE-associated domain